MPEKIAVLGAGANGASIAADLVRNGHDVVLIEQWPEHVRAMRSDGVRIVMPGETITVPVRVLDLCDVATLREQFDVVLVVMKAYDTRWSCQLIEPHLRPDGVVVAVQNGMTTDVVADVVGPHRTIGSVIEISSMLREPGIVDRHSPPERSWFAVGGIDPATAARETLVASLLACSGTVEQVSQIRPTKWMKLISNATTLVLTAILGLPVHTAAQNGQVRELMVRSGREAFNAGQLQEYPTLPIFGLSQQDLAIDPADLVDLLLDKICTSFTNPDTTTTVVHDWNHGRRSEVLDINGAVVREHASRGLHAPVNHAIVEVALRIESGDAAPGMGNLHLLREIADATRQRAVGGAPAAEAEIINA